MNIAPYIDHTILKPTTTEAEVRQLCAEALQEGFAAVCVPPYFVALAKELLDKNGRGRVKTATVIDFPFGYSSTGAKLEEIRQALADGADELDLVHNLAALRAGNWKYLEDEIRSATELVHAAGKHIKVIVESGILSEEELVRCCTVYGPLGIDFMKTSTGYTETGATVAAVQTMRRELPAGVRIKASGGIRTLAFARELVQAGADRLGCSASMNIVAESADKE